MKRRRGSSRLAWLLSGLVFVHLPVVIFPVRAQTYHLDRQSIVSAGGSLTSPAYSNQVSLGQVSQSGSSSTCNLGYQHSAGFWSVSGDVPVPSLLFITRPPNPPGSLTFRWSGTAPLFDLFRGGTAATLENPGNIWLTLTNCETTQPAGAPDFFFAVEPH